MTPSPPSNLVQGFCAFAALTLLTQPASADKMLAFEDSINVGLLEIDRTTGAVLGNSVPLDYRYISPDQGEFEAAAIHPGTGICYVLHGADDEYPLLCTLNLATGEFTPVAPVGVPNTPGGSPSITFVPAGAGAYTLYLITGGPSYSTNPGGIYTIDMTTGAATDSGWVTAGTGGHAIEYNPSDGCLYHFFKQGSTPGLEKFDVSTGIATNVGLTSPPFPAVNGLAYAGGQFYTVADDQESLYSITTAGVVVEVGPIVDGARALVSDGTNLHLLDEGFTVGIRTLDPNTGAETNFVAFGGVPDYQECDGLARDPTTGILWGLVHGDYASTASPGGRGRTLARIHPETGAITNKIDLSITNLGTLTFASDGTLYSVAQTSSFAPLPPGTLEGGTIVTIDKNTGTVTPQPWATTKYEFLSKSLAFNSSNGLLYYFRGGEQGIGNALRMQSIDPSNGTVTSFPDLLPGNGKAAQAATYDPESGLILLFQGDDLYSVTTAGVITLIKADVGPGVSTEGLTIIPEFKIESFAVNGTATMTFKSVANRKYGIFSRACLSGGSWQVVPGFNEITGTPPLNTVTGLPLPGSKKGFFTLGDPVPTN